MGWKCNKEKIKRNKLGDTDNCLHHISNLITNSSFYVTFGENATGLKRGEKKEEMVQNWGGRKKDRAGNKKEKHTRK